MKTLLKIIKPKYIRPEVTRIQLDNTISFVMMSAAPGDPGGTSFASKSNKKGTNEPFQSPFGDKPFN